MGRFHLKILLIVKVFLTTVITAPTFEKIKSQLIRKGFGDDIVSNDFQGSVTCVKCGNCLAFGPGQGPWTLKRHSGKESHKSRTAWTIDEEYNVVSLRSSGKCYAMVKIIFT